VKLSALRISEPEGEPRYRFLDAVRTLAIVALLLLHVVFYSSFFLAASDAQTLFGSLAGRVAMRGHFALDALFVITGFLIGYYILIDLERHRYAVWPWLFRRMARLVPAYFVVLLLYHFTMNFNIQYVWANLLFVNNNLPMMHQVMSWSWSLPVDAAFYLTLPILLVLVRNRSRDLLNALWIVLGALVVVRGIAVLAGHFGLPLAADPFHEAAAFERYFDGVYDKTQNRIGAIVAGLIVVTMLRYHDAEAWLRARPLVASLLAVASLVVAIAVVATPVFAGEAPSYDPMWSALYLILYNTVFSLAVATLMLLVVAGAPVLRPVHAFFAWRGWFVPAELCYGVFLLNPFVVLGIFFYVVHRPQVSLGAFLLYFVATLIGSFALAYVLYICVERPTREQSKRLARRFERRAPAVVAPTPATEPQTTA
jgi:peptidoglycan/LPS O-acetylase OafA/YrhL